MAYSKQNFQDGQILTAANLEKMENGIIAGQGAKNLLDNSNFADLVAHDGLNKSYGDTTYLADRWIGHYHITPTTRTDGIFLTTTDNYAFIQQRVRVKQGKTYTLALSTTGGTTMQRIAVFNIGLTEIFAAVEGSNSVIITTFNAAYDDMAMLFYPGFADGGGSAIFKWAALYEGAYDASTLPPYIPKGKRVEMLNCGVPLAPHNLLDNSDFRNPVAQAGIGGKHEGKTYVCDRWYDTYGFGTYSLSEGTGITLSYGTNHCYCVQKINNASQYYGKTMTLALQLSDGTTYVNSGTYLSSGISFRVSASNWLCDLHPDRIELVVTSDSLTVKWVAIYEGSYTAETIPAYVPKGKHVEMLNCGVPLAPHNLLDNSDFRNPVNQRGQTSYGTDGYTIDRWYFYNPNGDGTVTINNGYISLTGGSGAVSLSCRFPKGFLDASKTYTARICDNLGNINPTGLVFYDSFDSFELSAGAGETKNIVWAALYEGAYDASTLPAYQPKGYAAELAECMRYYRRFDEVASGFFISENGLQVEMPLNPPMRVVPTVTSITSPSAYTANGKVDVSGSYASTASKTKAGYVYYSPTSAPVGTPAVVSGMIAELSADL